MAKNNTIGPKFLISVLFAILSAGLLPAQSNSYWVMFKNKTGTPYSISNPSAFLSPKAIQRRANQNIPIDTKDLPVNPTYVQQVKNTGAIVLYASKWLNAVIVKTSNSSQMNAINSLTFVNTTQPVAKYQKMKDTLSEVPQHQKLSAASTTAFNYGPALTQVQQIGVDCMHNKGYRGQGMTIAVVDAGFAQVNTTAAYDSLFAENRVLGTYDFVNKETSVYEDDNHGAMVLSCMAANNPGTLIGTSPKASFWLLRSEDVMSEKLIEECYWVIAAEYADSVGADILTASLGYTTFDNSTQNHTYADLNGKTSVASQAATIGASRGMFMLVAAGNEGGNSWNYIGVPADADSVCTVGSVNGSGQHSSFSSVGPTADNRIKPDISTMGEGTYLCGPGNVYFAGNGTSFATPIAAGAVACLWQAHPTATNMQVFQAIRQTASRTNNPDNNYGWGIPDFCMAEAYLGTITGIHEQGQTPSFSLYPNPTNGNIYLRFATVPGTVRAIITDVLGKELSNDSYVPEAGNRITIQGLEQLPKGVYFVTVKTNAVQSTQKFIKE